MIHAQLLSAPVLSGSSLLWYTTRATGIVAQVLLTGTVMLGVIGTTRAATARWPRLVTASLHRNLALTSIALVAVHVVTTVTDPFASIGIVAAFVPFSSGYRPLWLSLGAVAFDLLLAVVITSLLRQRLNHRAWQAVHLLVYLSWPVALWHGLGTGTDTRLPWVLLIDLACVAGVGWAIWWRLGVTGRPEVRVAGQLALVLVPAATMLFVAVGPLQPGWARRAGTPAALLGTKSPAPAASQPGSSGSSGGQSAPLVNAHFTARLTVSNSAASGRRTITISGHTTGAASQAILIVLHGRPSGAGISLTDGTARVGPDSATGYSGPVIALTGRQLIASVSGPGGQRRAQFELTIHGSAVTGTVSLLSGDGE